MQESTWDATYPEMSGHHRRAVEALIDEVRVAAEFDAVILAGSLARGQARSDSDVDVYLVAPDETYEQRRAAKALAWTAPCEYDSGYVDGKIITLQMLRDVASRGSEPMRASFVGARVLYSRVGELQPLVDDAATYPEVNRDRNIKDFYAAFVAHAAYFGPQADSRGEAFLAAHAAVLAVLFSGRLLLAHNRVLYPCPKGLADAVASCPERPAAYGELTSALLARPDAAAFAALLHAIVGFHDWGVTASEALTTFLVEDEWSWVTGHSPLSHR